MRYQFCKILVMITFLVLGVTVDKPLHAQAISGDLVGTVLDKTGGVVPNATVEATNVATGLKVTAKTREQGEFRFSNLPVGTYTVQVGAPNFTSVTLTNIQIELNKVGSVSVTLEVGSQAVTVEVTGATPLINTTSAQLEDTFDSKQTSDLPISSIGLGVLNLALLEPGVASSGGVGAGTGPSVGGQRPRNNNFTIEGVDNNNKGVTGPLVSIPNDAVQEFSALQNQFSPEFGHSTGGQFNTVVVSGTNQFHGKAYEYFQNRNLNAIDQTVIQSGLTSNPRFDFNRYGGQIGGPVFKKKLFFFDNFEYDTLGQASVSAGGLCTPTAAGYTTLQGISGLSATNLGILQKYGLPAPTGQNCGNVPAADPKGFDNVRDPSNKKGPSPACPKLFCIYVTNPADPNGYTGVEAGAIGVSAPNYANGKFLTTSMDYDLSSKDQIRGRYIYNSIVGIDIRAALGAFYQGLPNKFHLVTLAEYHTFGANLSNEFRAGFNRFANNTPAGSFKFPGLDSFPNVSFNDLGLNIGPDPNAPQETIQNLYQASDNVIWTKGRHTWKFGVEGRKFISPQSFTQRSRGDYIYSSLDLYLHDLNPDVGAQRSSGNPIFYGDQAGVFWYVNDDWKIRHNITLNLGLRYEYMTIPTGERQQKLNAAASAPGLISFDEPRAPKKDFMPRVGLAWSPGSSGNSSIRAGFGMGYDVLYDNIGILSLPPQLSSTLDKTAPPVITNFLANGGILPGSGGLRTFPSIAAQRAATSAYVTVNQKDPYAEEWDLSVQHKFGSKYSVEARYLGTRGVHLDEQLRINKIARVDSTHFLPTYLTMPTQATLDGLTNTLASLTSVSNIRADYLAAGFTNSAFVQDSPTGWSSYHGLAFQANRQFSSGLQFSASYTWSHLIDNSTADFNSTVLSPRRPQDFQSVDADKSNSALDRRHRITLAAYYDLPYFKNGNWLKRNVVGNWLFAPIYIYQAPEWATVESGTDSNLNGDAAPDRTVFNPKGTPGTGSGVTALKNTAGATVAYLANNPNAQYIQAGLGALATAGRNTLSTRPIDNIDLTASKKFNLTERFKIEFQAQFLNILNHPQYLAGFTDRVDQVSFPAGASPGPTSYLTATSTAFNKPSLAWSNNPRNMQLAAKFTF
jgi:hypothetical protein